MPARWICAQCQSASWERPTCVHRFWHLEAKLETEQFLWWRWRMKAKPAAHQQAIAEAGKGLRYGSWERVIAALRQNAEIYNRKFVVASEPLIL